MFHEKSVFLTHSVGNFPLRTLIKSFDTASVVGTDLPEDAKYDHVDNHDAELTCNIVTDLGIKVDNDVIAMIKSSIRVSRSSDVFQYSAIQRIDPHRRDFGLFG